MVLLSVVVLQVVIKLLNGHDNNRLITFGNGLAVYVYNIFRYLTFNTEEKPFPFSSWDSGIKTNTAKPKTEKKTTVKLTKNKPAKPVVAKETSKPKAKADTE